MFQASNIGFAACYCEWFESSDDFKRSLRILMTKEDVPQEINYAELYKFSVDCLLEVILLLYCAAI